MVHSVGAAVLVEGIAAPYNVVVQSVVMVVAVGDTLVDSWIKETPVLLV